MSDDKRELRVRGCASDFFLWTEDRGPHHKGELARIPKGRVVILECESGRAGDFEPWMVERLQAFRGLYGREVDEGDLLNLEAIATAIESILKEA